jgi:hypothetical protein
MTVDPGGQTRADQTPEGDTAESVSPRARLGLGTVTVLLVLWFLFAWLVLDRHFLDAAGESVGTAFALGVIASLVAALRG